ncbi:unnamed protein product [Citrullus colocynthis]|uniref:Uncharacterized protein n=1 Tax=Citrullus colocynthis TaxID=252529 RepID=A0ABP0ZBY6_9ROSI
MPSSVQHITFCCRKKSNRHVVDVPIKLSSLAGKRKHAANITRCRILARVVTILYSREFCGELAQQSESQASTVHFSLRFLIPLSLSRSLSLSLSVKDVIEGFSSLRGLVRIASDGLCSRSRFLMGFLPAPS